MIATRHNLEIAAFRQSIYHIFSECLLHPPSTQRLPLFQDLAWRQSAVALLGPEMEQLCVNLVGQADANALAVEHAALFVVPGPQQTFPFETNYRQKISVEGKSKPGKMLGRPAAQVRTFYQEWGLPGDLQTDELPDHAGVELRFMSLLVAAERLAVDCSDEACARGILLAEAEFLNAHIMQWFPQWLECVRQRSHQIFYRTAVTVLKRFLETEQVTLDQLISAASRETQ